jgi:hypothetical protein
VKTILPCVLKGYRSRSNRQLAAWLAAFEEEIRIHGKAKG